MILNDSILIFVLGFLTLAVTLSLWLNFRLIRAFRLLPLPTSSALQKLTEGTLIADFSLERITDKKTLTLYEYHEYAKVLVFLTSKCSKCKSKLPELRTAIGRANNLGVAIWILSLETKGRMRNFLNDDVLLEATMSTSQPTYDYVNPEGASPYYLFIDSENILQAQGFIGDENWDSFMEQLNEGQ